MIAFLTVVIFALVVGANELSSVAGQIFSGCTSIIIFLALFVLVVLFFTGGLCSLIC